VTFSTSLAEDPGMPILGASRRSPFHTGQLVRGAQKTRHVGIGQPVAIEIGIILVRLGLVGIDVRVI